MSKITEEELENRDNVISEGDVFDPDEEKQGMDPEKTPVFDNVSIGDIVSKKARGVKFDLSTAKQQERFRVYKERFDNGDNEEKRVVGELAVMDLEGLMDSVLRKFYTWRAYREDIKQEMRIAVLQNFENYDPAFPPSHFFYSHLLHAATTYLYENVQGVSRYFGEIKIAVSRAQNELRKSNGDVNDILKIAKLTGLSTKTVKQSIEQSRISNASSFEVDCENESVGSLDPASKAIADEQSSILWRGLNSLTKDQRNILIMSSEGKTCVDICEEMKKKHPEDDEKIWSSDKIRSLLNSAKNIMKQEIGSYRVEGKSRGVKLAPNYSVIDDKEFDKMFDATDEIIVDPTWDDFSEDSDSSDITN